MRRLFVLVACCSALLQSCASSNESEKYGKDVLRITGTMQYEHIEGGCWQFVTEDGTAFEITGVGLTPLLQDGLRAEIIVRPLKNTASVCMAGKIVELIKIIKIFD